MSCFYPCPLVDVESFSEEKGAIAVSVFPEPVGMPRRMSWWLRSLAIASR
ncbi:MAG: hypothetical protein V7K98_26180 [Nostoc sp.]